MKTVSAGLIVGFTVHMAFAKPQESVPGEFFANVRGKQGRITLIQKNREFLIHGTSSVSIPGAGLRKRSTQLHDVKSDLDISEVVYESDDMAASLEANEGVRYYSHKYSDGAEDFYITQDVIVKVKDEVTEAEFRRILRKHKCEVTRGKFSDRKWSIQGFSNLRIQAKSSKQVLKTLSALYQVAEFSSVELPRTYSVVHDAVDLPCGGPASHVNDPLLVDDETDLTRTPNRSFANVFPAWCFNRGAGVRIGILDFGFNVGHPEVIGQIADSFNVATASHSGLAHFINGSSNNSSTNHGTTISGLLVGTANNANLAAGIAPAARAFVCRVTDGTSATQWVDALQFFIDNDVHVVSSSIRFSIAATANNSSAADQQFFNLVRNNDAVWCQSTSNCDNDCSVSGIPGGARYPVELQSANQGAFGNAFFNVAGLHTTVAGSGFQPLQKRLGARGPEINIAYPAIQNLVYNTGNYSMHDHAVGTSWATPAVAGIVALVRSQMIRETGNAGSVQDVIRIVEASAMREPTYTARAVNGSALDFTDNYNQTYGFGIPDALAAVQQVKREFGGRKLAPIFNLLLD